MVITPVFTMGLFADAVTAHIIGLPHSRMSLTVLALRACRCRVSPQQVERSLSHGTSSSSSRRGGSSTVNYPGAGTLRCVCCRRDLVTRFACRIEWPLSAGSSAGLVGGSDPQKLTWPLLLRAAALFLYWKAAWIL